MIDSHGRHQVIVGTLCMLGVVALWSITPILIKILLRTLDPFTIAFLRLLQGTGVLLAAHRVAGGQIRDTLGLTKWHLIGGVGIGVNYALFALALKYTTASIGVLVIQIQHVTLAVLAAVILDERLGPARIAAICSVLIGVTLITTVQDSAPGGTDVTQSHILGGVIMAVAAIGWGVYALSNKALSRTTASIPIVIPMMLIALMITGALAAFNFELRSSPTVASLATLLVLGAAATGGSIFLIAEGMRRLSSAFAGTLTGITPLIQIALASAILGENLSVQLLGAAFFIVTGVLTIGLTEKPRRRDRGRT